jgi:hypothetical protein
VPRSNRSRAPRRTDASCNCRTGTASGIGRTYRFYDSTTPLGPPLWPFGHGLSYSTFDVRWSDGGGDRRLCVDCGGLGGASPRFSRTATITNTGTVPAAKVVMAFVGEAEPRARLHRDHGGGADEGADK